MTKRSLVLVCIGIVLVISAFMNRSQEAQAIQPRDFRKFDQPMLSVRVSCQDIGPRADISWTPIDGATFYTLTRKAEQENDWTVINESTESFAFTDTAFPILPDAYEYQIRTEIGRRDGVSPLVAVSIPSCGIADTPSDQTTLGDPMITSEAAITNLIKNPSFEVSGTNSNPQNWQRGGWGVNDGKYIYPTTGKDGGKAAKVEMTSRTTGDIKWFFDDVPVTAGNTYTISHSYKSTETTELTARFTGPQGVSYQYIKMLPETADWTISSLEIVIPKNVTSMTLFHILYSPGSLEIDSFSMTPGSVVTPPPPPVVPSPAPNLISNPSLEIAGNSGNPKGWFRGGWGSNTRSYTYPTTGGDGAKAAKVEITSYTNGDAKWYFEDVPVTGGKEYAFSHLYKASTPTEIVARFTTNSGVEYHHVSTVPTAANWSASNDTMTAPTNALSVTLFHLLTAVGTLETDAFSMIEKTDSVPQPTPIASKYILLNAINWNDAGLNTLPIGDASEITYFVLPVSATGQLLSTSPTTEAAFVKNIHAGGKKATFSIAGGAQNVEDITAAVTSNSAALINNIVEHIALHNYDGVTVDIENTNIAAQTMADFIKALRVKLDTLRSNLILGIYTQPYQIDTVWKNIAQIASSLTWLAPMMYDRGLYTAADFLATTQAWESRVPKEKLLGGVAVNYPTQDGGLSVDQFKEVLDMIDTNNWSGVGIWQNTLYTQPWRDVRRTAWPAIQ